MARVFTTDFIFKEKSYKAIVVIQDNVNGLKVRVRFFGADHLFSNDSIEFAGLSGYKRIDHLQPEAISLLDELHKAIIKHLSEN